MDEERLAELLRLLPAPPEHVVDAVLRLADELGPPAGDVGDDPSPGDDAHPHAPFEDWHESDPGAGGAGSGGAGDDLGNDFDDGHWS